MGGLRPQHRERDFGRDFNTHMHQQHTTPYDDFSFMHEANRTYYHRDESSPPVAPDTSRAPDWFTQYRLEQQQQMNMLCNSVNRLEVGLHQHMTQYDQDQNSLSSTIVGMRQDMSVLNDNMFTVSHNQNNLRGDLDEIYSRVNDNNNMLAAVYNHNFGTYPQGHDYSRNPYAFAMDTNQAWGMSQHEEPTSPGGGPL